MTETMVKEVVGTEEKTKETFTVRELNGLLTILRLRGEESSEVDWMRSMLEKAIAGLLKTKKQEITLGPPNFDPEFLAFLREVCNDGKEYYKAKNFNARHFGQGRR